MCIMKVAKFGGSSVADAGQLKKVAKIIQSDPARRVIVVSAPGKRHNNDIKVTDLLIELGQSFIKKNSYQEELNQVIARYQSIIDDLGLSQQVLGRIETNIKAVFAGEGDLDFKLEALKSSGEDSLAQLLRDRKSTRLNSSHVAISYAVFCLKTKRE